MNPILSEIFSGPWLISKERSTAYASILLALIRGENWSAGDLSEARARNRSFVVSLDDTGSRLGFNDPNIPADCVAVIPILSEIFKYDQPCGPRGTQSILSDLNAAGQNPNIRSILLLVDSPGGQVAGTDLLAEAVSGSSKPVVAFIDGMAASAAYWIISGAQKIIASSDLDRIGSIGTMLLVEDLQPYFESQGVKFHEVYATLSTDKNSDFNEVLDGKYDNYREHVLDVINQKFLASIRKNRPQVDNSALTGKVFFASDAIKMGLVDEIGSFDSALELAFQLGKPENVTSELHEPNKQHTMKIKETWKAILGYFKMDPSDPQAQELTSDQMQQLNDELATVTVRNVELEEELAREKEAHLLALSELEKLRSEDAGGETVAPKSADKFPGEGDEEKVYSHDRIADEFCGKQ